MENVMVPREPTEEMIAAGRCCQDKHDGTYGISPERGAYITWKRMLAAAPTVEQEPVANFPIHGEPLCESELRIINAAKKRAEILMNSVTAELCIYYRQLLAHPSPPADKQAAQLSAVEIAAIGLVPFLKDGFDEDDGFEHFEAGQKLCDILIKAVEELQAIRAEALKVSAGGR